MGIGGGAMTRSYLATILALVIGIALCLAATCGPARADTASAMRVLCGARGVAIIDRERGITLPESVDNEALTEGVPPMLLAALIASESRCKVNADSGNGDLGLGQLRVGGSAAYGYARREILRPWFNVYLTARHLGMWLRLCNGYVPGALSGYRGLRGCRDSKGSQRVLRLVHKAQEAESRS
jgi:hypothetical protein